MLFKIVIGVIVLAVLAGYVGFLREVRRK